MWKTDKTDKVPILQKLSILIGIIILFVGTITLVGWMTNVSFLVNLMPDYVPMAVPNCIFFMIYGVIFIFSDELFNSKINKVIVLAVIGLSSLYGFLQFAGNLVSRDLNFDFTLFPVREKLGNFPIGHMSPYAGLIFFESGIAILLKGLITDRAIVRNITAGLGIIVAFAGFVAGLGYLLGTPFLYSGNVIPLSLRTAILFIFLGFGLIFIAGENTVFLRQLIGPRPEARLLRILIPIIISVFLFEGVLDVIFTHYYKINEALLLAFLTIFSVILCIIVIINLSKVIFQSASIAETARFKAIEELRKANLLQNLILENSTMGICLVHNHEFQWNNSRFSEIFQLTIRDLNGYSTSIILKSDEVFEKRTSWLDIMKNESIVDKTIQFSRSTGELFWVRFIGTPLDRVSPNEGSVWMVEDITERKRLREKMRLLSHTVESLAECVSITDTTDRIIFVNKAFEELYGYKQEEIIDKNISIVSSPNNDPQLIHSILPATLNGGWKGEVINRRKNGTEFPVFMTTSVLVDDKGEVVALVGVATDITKRKDVEKQLKKYSEDLKRSNDAKDKLFSIISHDLKSPFNSILGFLNLLSEQYDDFSEDERKSVILDLKKSSENTFVLLENLLTWSRTQTDGIKVNSIYFELAEVVDQQFEVLKSTAASKSINLKNHVSNDIKVYADKDMVKTILINLTNNAIKFTRPEGVITVTAKINDNYVEISVEDKGVGIAGPVLENMFESGKLHSTLGTSKEKGTGLGLLICKEFTERNNGRIWAESETGKGSTFIFTLPLYSNK